MKITFSKTNEPGEVRCGCGALLARWVPAGLELSCRRCRRRVVIPYPEDRKRD